MDGSWQRAGPGRMAQDRERRTLSRRSLMTWRLGYLWMARIWHGFWQTPAAAVLAPGSPASARLHFSVTRCLDTTQPVVTSVAAHGPRFAVAGGADHAPLPLLPRPRRRDSRADGLRPRLLWDAGAAGPKCGWRGRDFGHRTDSGFVPQESHRQGRGGILRLSSFFRESRPLAGPFRINALLWKNRN